MLSFIKNGANIFRNKQEDILSAAFVIAFSVALSRVLGLVRYRLLASYFGDNIKLLDSFIAASILPDAIFEVLIFGTIALAFIPVFSQYLSRDKLKKAWELSSIMISLGLLVFVVFAAIIIVLADFIAPIIAPGVVAKDPATSHQIAQLLRIMIFAQAFFVISIFMTGILQSFQRFLVPALASVFYNIGIILSIIFLVPVFGIYAPAIGMIIGALLHLTIQVPLALSLGFSFRLNFDLNNKDVRETISLMWPRSISLSLVRISDMINIALASIAAVGSIVAFNFAQVLQYVPTAMFAASIAQASLPSLSIEFNAKRYEQFKKLFTQSFHQILFLILPAAAILAILRIPVVRLVFGARELPWEITVLTGRTLIAFSVGIAAQAVSLLLTRGFYAIKDSFTPVKVNIFSITVNIALALFFVLILKLSLIWLALAYSTANITNSLLLFILLDKKVGFDKKKLLAPVAKMSLIGFITAVFLYVPMKLLDQLVFDTTRTVGLILLTGIATIVGLSVYILLSWVMRVKEVAIFYHLAKRVLALPSKLTSPAPTSIEAQEQNP
ncbi:murein biosynthesis integral membrane protein MurJ [Candidatus Curtissbacteria bacterium RIFCSPHIGHO2_01_FULL_41_44]|uniref:Probable lipid II flippase MurJ n=1 Tax=Candidatus Curtissbacteria bacterium RIFCSPLOWO2_01_FULL_42_50 TaxID=1797730 RepID=A0A1F5H4A9_9BACT|nr:MAG: murein biosynthesis integral membrane protein MurJ [Candidatus Curtissbacteria bacterium RIFCSPHIGHO2_01_FULL_41_44]OGD93382.1 MAG: murein biosynthesis integral membrane protein MurJ [Candidatus Curtissbacteria bacterium RIFCSPHIGHO2_02_FULL_42_58]OGD97098.1 MAG: murein biosynthesis integral membrane protein MurJ [Candidatus Curtissbacteria bacterium RIFCSPHIGHO2_12_FULL_42_33]OGD98887.1 MAG: murein biosynthesis integral membrane protein MurJ [Candidatus Curtissbacteria bacterium RIFCSPL